ncbi:FAD-dependent oxidoreductase [Sodalis sp. dw_96]|uniref:FAD-dependent oxidoreductase n=1 Tax=Sodalis sp. dw_96 TaxID=2719794 RepID=UPI001BD6AF79|nr:FAD-dependent oxidoreductase [Sodalis sp. dw_96]
MLTDILGGRIRYSEEEKVNFGAYFVMSNYHFAKKLVTRRTWINPFSVTFHNNDKEWFNTISLHSVMRLPQLVKFYIALYFFIRHYSRYKIRCQTMPQRQAMAADPYIDKLFHQRAADFIREKGFEKAAHDYVSKFSYACTGVDMNNITALDMMNCCMGLGVPIHRFSFDRQAIESKLGYRARQESVEKIQRFNNGYLLETASGAQYSADNVVLATPAFVTKKLLNLDIPLRQTCQLYVYHVEAVLKEKYADRQMNVFSFESEIVFTAIMDDGSYLIYARDQNEKLLDKVCSHYKILGKVGWDKAMYVYGDAYMEQDFEDGLYIAGDHNGLGLEPTALSGVYAANRIIKKYQR